MRLGVLDDSYGIIFSSSDGIFNAVSADFKNLKISDRDMNVCINNMKNLLRNHIYINGICMGGELEHILADYEFIEVNIDSKEVIAKEL